MLRSSSQSSAVVLSRERMLRLFFAMCSEALAWALAYSTVSVFLTESHCFQGELVYVQRSLSEHFGQGGGFFGLPSPYSVEEIGVLGRDRSDQVGSSLESYMADNYLPNQRASQGRYHVELVWCT